MEEIKKALDSIEHLLSKAEKAFLSGEPQNSFTYFWCARFRLLLLKTRIERQEIG